MDMTIFPSNFHMWLILLDKRFLVFILLYCFYVLSIKSWHENIMLFDPRGRPTVTAGSDHYFRTWCPSNPQSVRLSLRMSVPIFQNVAKQNNFQVRIVITTGETMGLAVWIIVGTKISCFFSLSPTMIHGQSLGHDIFHEKSFPNIVEWL